MGIFLKNHSFAGHRLKEKHEVRGVLRGSRGGFG